MYRIIVNILTVCFLISCSSNKKELNNGDAPSGDFIKLDTIISISGGWISENYYNSIREFKSPKKAQDGSLFITIPERTLQKTILAYNFHEGMGIKILKNNDTFEAWEFEDDSLVKKLHSIEIISSDKISLDSIVFHKISTNSNPANKKILEDMIFKGNYKGSNSTNIEFKSNGELWGLDNFHFYQPILDYYDAGLQVDQIGFGNSEKDLEYFGFKFNKDTLEIYKLNCLTYDSTEKRCVDVTFGLLAYKMWKIK